MQLELSDIVKLFNRIEALESKVAELEARLSKADEQPSPVLSRPAFPVGRVSEKYKLLAEYLYEGWERRVELTYAQVEEVLGFALPQTAYKMPHSFWANTNTHSYASGWMSVGYKAKVAGDQKVIFERDLYKGD